MTTTAPRALTTARLLRAASDAEKIAALDGIVVDHVSISVGLGVRLHPVDDSLTPALAVALGLTGHKIGLHSQGPIEFFDGELDGVAVSTHWPLPEDVPLWTFRYFSDSEPCDHEGFAAGYAFTSYDAARDAARDLLGGAEWGQSGRDEYPYRDRLGRTGYVYVRAVAR